MAGRFSGISWTGGSDEYRPICINEGMKEALRKLIRRKLSYQTRERKWLHSLLADSEKFEQFFRVLRFWSLFQLSPALIFGWLASTDHLRRIAHLAPTNPANLLRVWLAGCIEVRRAILFKLVSSSYYPPGNDRKLESRRREPLVSQKTAGFYPEAERLGFLGRRNGALRISDSVGKPPASFQDFKRRASTLKAKEGGWPRERMAKSTKADQKEK
ncbi:hypothetical protein NPIL_29291 [Nephila pilipes]|uniref:Uncharacterized protein n=1 Tax=Nephila pilipes TaxID=299642 RepID=A0A8X6MRK7_NEPPI|nr:hypothetical protein NPIL_29291 [Nephila pilipes]